MDGDHVCLPIQQYSLMFLFFPFFDNSKQGHLLPSFFHWEASFRRLFVYTQADSNTPLISDSAKTEDGILLDGSGQESVVQSLAFSFTDCKGSGSGERETNSLLGEGAWPSRECTHTSRG